MKNFNGFLDFIFTDKTASMYFYIVLGGLSLIFIILIIVTLSKMSKEKKELANKDLVSKISAKPEENAKENGAETKKKTDDALVKEEEVKTDDSAIKTMEDNPDYGSETMTLNSILMDKDSSDESVSIDNEDVGDTVYLDKEELVTSDYDFSLLNNEVPKEEVNLEKQDDNIGSMLNDVKIDSFSEEAKPLSEVPTLDSVTDDFLNDIYNTGSLEVQGELGSKSADDNFEIKRNEGVVTKEDLVLNTSDEENDIKAITDTVKNEEAENLDETKKEDKEESLHKSFVSNDELMKRLAKLRMGHKDEKESAPLEENQDDDELESIMKAVGLEDTMVIPNIKSEKQILGK